MRKLLFASALVSWVASSTVAYAQSCPVALPVPADQAHVECKAAENTTRCGAGLPTNVCNQHNQLAIDNGLITSAAYNWLTANRYCAVTVELAPGFYTVISICPAGCFEENTEILTVNDYGAEEWLAAEEITKEHELYSLNSDALLSSPALSSRAVERMARGPEEADLYVFAMSNGKKLRVTTHHGMVLADGRVVAAKDVVLGDAFIGLDGSIVEIDGIGREPTDGDVYNYYVSADTPQEHVIVAEGVLVGDLAWQTSLAGEIESIRLRK